jgi:hypothetical protein
MCLVESMNKVRERSLYEFINMLLFKKKKKIISQIEEQWTKKSFDFNSQSPIFLSGLLSNLERKNLVDSCGKRAPSSFLSPQFFQPSKVFFSIFFHFIYFICVFYPTKRTILVNIWSLVKFKIPTHERKIQILHIPKFPLFAYCF